MRALLLCLMVACAPEVAGPIEHQRTLDRDDEVRLAHQLAALPGAVDAEVLLHRPMTDPLGASQPGGAAVIVMVDDHADRAAIDAAARRLVHATAPDVTPTVLVEVAAVRPALASLGPFTVEAHTRPRLVAALAVAFAAIAALAGWIALGYRRGRSAQ